MAEEDPDITAASGPPAEFRARSSCVLPLEKPRRCKAVVVFVHGLFGDNSSWGRFPELLAADDEVRGSYDLAFYTYSSPRPAFWRNPVKRIPTILSLAKGLKTFLETTLGHYERLVLVGHSMGGLVILRLLAEAVRASRAADLGRVAAAVLFATPNQGSDFARRLREQLKRFWRSPQLEALEPLAADTQQTLDTVVHQIDQARRFDGGHCPVRIVACAGTDDEIVTPESAESVFRHKRTLSTKDHSTISRPEDEKDISYEVLRQELDAALETVLPSSQRLTRATTELVTLVVGGKIFLESSLLGEIMAQVIEHETPAGVAVDRQLDIGETSETYQRLVNGRIHLYAEYTGTLLREILELPGCDVEDHEHHSAEWIRSLLRERPEYRTLRVGPKFGLNNSYALVMRDDQARELGVTDVAGLQAKSEGLRFSSHWSFYRRRDGLPCLEQRYGPFAFAERNITPAYGKYDLLERGEVDVVTGYSTDPEVALGRGPFTVLEDNKRAFGDYFALPFYHRRILEQVPELSGVLELLEGRIDNPRMARLIATARERGLGAGELTAPQKYDLYQLIQEFLDELGLFGGRAAAEGARAAADPPG